MLLRLMAPALPPCFLFLFLFFPLLVEVCTRRSELHIPECLCSLTPQQPASVRALALSWRDRAELITGAALLLKRRKKREATDYYHTQEEGEGGASWTCLSLAVFFFLVSSFFSD